MSPFQQQQAINNSILKEANNETRTFATTEEYLAYKKLSKGFKK